ncbi:unnamed protein product [Nesidiocoris tenuis]|uniref:Diacylglycerol kinase accessory domain-containing protein n=1 Tax=Nesidiocoris tenuis TaxID=355587 RepID=A0A6H5GN48_9HEMI|nr:unnamed protein product [Nesidiocoris tenuis]
MLCSWLQSGSTVSELHDLLSGRHHWQATSHARPTYCNICRDALSGSDDSWEAVRPQGCSPLLVFVNSKSGDNQGLPTQEHLKMRANSLKRAVRQLIEHSERVVDEQQNMARASEAVKGISGPTPDQLDIIDKRELMSISPLPPFRRDSNCSTGDMFMGNLPVPTEFADSRRPSASKITASSTLAPEEFSSEKIEVTADVEKRKNDAETPDDDLGMTIGRHVHDDDDEVCAAVDEGILSGLQLKDELANIGHIDSSETSDDSPEGTTELAKRELKTFRVNSKRLRQSIKFKTGSFENIDATNLISTSPDEDDDYDELLVLDNPINKRCSIAHFIEGSDIARRSIKCRHRKQTSMDDLDLEAVTVDTKDIFRNIPVIQVSSESDPTDDRCAPNRQSIRRAVKSDRLDVIQVTIQGSNNNLRGSTDGMFLSEYHHDTVHRKSLALSETDDEELVRTAFCAESSFFSSPDLGLGTGHQAGPAYSRMPRKTPREMTRRSSPVRPHPDPLSRATLNVCRFTVYSPQDRINRNGFMGGTNFWGGTKEGEVFLAPCVDDQILEVVAVFGSVQMAASRLINLQHHRIAQCHTVQINITGNSIEYLQSSVLGSFQRIHHHGSAGNYLSRANFQD